MSRLNIQHVSKNFPGVRALDGVSLEVAPGEIHAICGENGAGKSTLVKIIAGVYAPDAGVLELDGASLAGIDEARAGRLGIGIVHQEGSLVQTLSVAENVFAGRQPVSRFGMVDRQRMNEEATKLGAIVVCGPEHGHVAAHQDELFETRFDARREVLRVGILLLLVGMVFFIRRGVNVRESRDAKGSDADQQPSCAGRKRVLTSSHGVISSKVKAQAIPSIARPSCGPM